MVGHFPTNMHMGAFMFVANIAQPKSIPKINLTWDLKVLGLHQLMKNLGMAIQKRPSPLA
jgi:hypothetical protein